MVKSEINLSFNVLKNAAKRLPVKDRAKLLEHLLKDKETWRKQFRQVMRDIRARVKKYPLSQEEIDKAVEEARQEVYDKSRP